MTHDDETVERVARAIYEATTAGDYEKIDERSRQYLRTEARAAIAAMPERDEEDDTILRISSINEHGEAPDGSVWRNIVINGEHYTIPYEVAMWFVHRGDQRDAQRELLREALEALEPFAYCSGGLTHRDYDARVVAWIGEPKPEGFGAYGIHAADMRRARAVADKIRAALTQEKQT